MDLQKKERDRTNVSYYDGLHQSKSGEINAQKNRKYPATARSGRANSCDRGKKRDLGYVEVCADRGGLAAALGHRRSDQDDCR